MPIYEYRCDQCGHTFDVFQKFSDPPVETCEKCSGTVTKVLHPAAIHFKGSGFYTTDYGSGRAKKRLGTDGDEKKPSSSDGKKADKEPAAKSSSSGESKAKKPGEK